MGGIISGIGSWIGSSAQNVANGVAGAPGWVWDGITHPAEALASMDARNHGFNSTEAYNAYLAKQPSSGGNFGTGNPAVDSVLNTVGGIGVHVGAGFDGSGVNAGTGMGGQASTVTKTDNSVEAANQFRQSQINAMNPAPAPTDAQVNPAMGDAYKNQAGPPSVHMFNEGDIDPGTGLQYSGGNTGWVSQTQYAQMHNIPSSTVPLTVAQQQIASGNARPGDHQLNPVTGVPQTFGIDRIWRDGNSAGPPTASQLPTNPNPTNQTPIGQVNTTTNPPLQNAAEWQQKYDDIWTRYRNFEFDPTTKQQMLDQLGPKPGAPGTVGSGTPPLVTTAAQNPTVGVGQPGGPSGPPAPGATGTNPGATGTNPGGAAADAGILAALKGMGIDPNTALLIAGAGGGALTSYLAAHEQSQAATAAAAAQAKGYGDALNQQQAQFDKTNEINAGIYKDQQANIKPWLDGGTKALRELETFDTYNPFPTTQQFDYNNWKDPGYQFRLDKGMDALQNSAAAKGGLLSGNTLKGITDYGQDAASQEYNNAFQRFTTKSTNDFNQGMAQRGMKLGELQSLAGIGQTATQQVNAAGSNYAGNAQQNGQNNSAAQGSIYTGSGNAAAAGINGAANANASGMVGMSNAFIGGLQQYYNNQNSQGLLNALMTRNK